MTASQKQMLSALSKSPVRPEDLDGRVLRSLVPRKWVKQVAGGRIAPSKAGLRALSEASR